MIERIIDWCASNRFLVFTATVIVAAWGIWAMTRTPLDAVPDISDVQVIVSTEWMGRSPDLIEDQITYPIVTALHGLRYFVRVRDLSGSHGPLLGAQPRRRIPAGHSRATS